MTQRALRAGDRGGGLPSAAHDHATGVVKERMEMME